jgi:hypothetical protein
MKPSFINPLPRSSPLIIIYIGFFSFTSIHPPFFMPHGGMFYEVLIFKEYDGINALVKKK